LSLTGFYDPNWIVKVKTDVLDVIKLKQKPRMCTERELMTVVPLLITP